MKSPKVLSWFLIAGALLHYTSGLGDSERIGRPTKCSSKGERFKHGHKYVYTYKVTITSGLPAITAATTDSRLSCRVVVSVPRRCELTVQLPNCELHHRLPNQDFVINENSHRLAKELKRSPMYLQYNDGEVISHKIAVFDSEPQHVINIKKGIISILQLKVISHQKMKGHPQSLHDVFGTCSNYMSTPPDSDLQVESYRDLINCNLSHVSRTQAEYLSFIKSVNGGHRFSSINELTYPFKLDVTCKHSVTPALRIEVAHCVQRHIYQPWFSGTGIQGRPSTQIRYSQHMKLESDTPLLPQVVDHSLTGRHWEDLAMGFAMTGKSGSTGQDVMEALEQTVIDSLAQGSQDTAADSFPAASFKTLVHVMRGTTERELRLIKDTIYSCRNSSCHKRTKDVDQKMLQSLEETLFYNGLMSCGTESCMAVFAACIRDDLLPDSEARSVVYNMGLFYQPSIKVLHTIFEHCKNKDSQGCWLSLGAMIRRLTSDVHNSLEATSVVFEVISHLHQMIGDKCHRGIPDNLKTPEKTLALEKLLMAIKALANIGEGAEHLYNKKLHSNRTIVSTLSHCVRNRHLNVIVSRSAAQALKLVGLQPHVVSELLSVADDEKRPFVLRAAIIDILILHNDEATLRRLLDKLHTTRNENLQMYMVTRVTSLLESLQPEFYEIKSILRNMLKDRGLPQLNQNIQYKSLYTQYSHRFKVPLMPLHIGGYVTVNLIYTPSSNVFQSLTLEAGYIVDNKTVHVSDITIDLEGVESLLEMMNKMEEGHKHFGVPTNILDVLEILQKYVENASAAKIPVFAHYSDRIKMALKDIFRLANFQKVSFPYAYLSLKVFGYEMGSVSSDKLLMIIKQMQPKTDFILELTKTFTEGIQTMFLRAFTLVDLHKVIPTVSGFPLETHVDSSFVMKTFVAAKTSVESFIAHKKSILTDFALRPSISSTFQVSVKALIGEYTSSGMTLKASGVVMADSTGLIKYLFPKNSSGWQHDVKMNWNLEQNNFRFLNIRSYLHLLHNDEEYEVSQTNLEKQLQKCLPDIYTRFFGHKMCVSGASYSSTGTRLDPTFLVMNPFRMEGIITPADDDLTHFSLHLKYQKRPSHPHGYYMMVVFEGPGKELSRQVSVTIDTNYHSGSLEMDVDIPDLGLRYYLRRTSFSKNSSYHQKHASVLSRHGKALSSFIIERRGSHVVKMASTPAHKFMEYNETRKSVHLNISFGVLSVDLTYRDYVPVPTNWLTDVTFSYHCEPDLRLLYTLHPDPHLAAIQGHTSAFSYHQETYDSKTSFSETWKGDNKMVITLPGQNITMVTDMIADLNGAHRVTDVYWKYGNKTDFYHMNSSAHNQSTTALFNFNYFLHLSGKDKFDLDIEGHVRGPRLAPLAMLNITTDISFNVAQETHDKTSQHFLSLILQGLDNTEQVTSQESASGHESAKSKLASAREETEQQPVKDDAEVTTELMDDKQTEQIIQKPFWEYLNWSVAIDTQIRLLPHMISTPGGGKRKAGLELQWMIIASSPRGENQVFILNGSIFRGQTNWMKLWLEDRIHNLKFIWQAEHNHTPKIIYHHHNWTLVETHNHSFDRSFNMRVYFEHYERFEYDVVLCSPWTNVTHHINYTKISATDHIVQAFARVHSLRPAFDLVYYESSNVSNGDVITHTNLTSTFLDHQFYLTKLKKLDGIILEGNLHIFGRLPILKGKRTLSMALMLSRQKPPVSEWTYLDDHGSGTKIVLSLLGPSKITLEVKVIHPNVSRTHSHDDSVMWTLELVASRYLQHTVQLSPEMLKKIQHTASMLHKIAPYIIRRLGDLTVHNILADLKDKILPFVNEKMDELLKARLQVAMNSDTESNMAKLYKLTLGGVNDINSIWVRVPIVQFMKESHFDHILASCVQSFSDLMIAWAHHPPFLICQFAKIYIQPILQQTLKSKVVTFSTPLPFVQPAFNKIPHLTSLERSVFGIIKHKITGAVTVNKDIAVILEGHRIKTFDGLVFDIAEPARSVCTYLLGADFRHGQFGLTYTKEGVTAFSSKYGLTLARDGSVFTVQDHPISHLPYTSPDGQLFLSLHKGELHMTFVEEFVGVTFNPENDFYLIEIDKQLKNTSIGLLGTNNHESSDDFLLTNGSVSVSSGEFQNSFELTNNKQCLVSSLSPPTLCEKSDFPSCLSLSDKWQPLSPCLQVLNPQPFILQCQMAECEGLSGCSAVQAYQTACRHQGINVGNPGVCAGHQQKSGLDIVIVQSLHHSVIRDQDPLIVCRKLVTSLFHLDLSVGLITYGGAKEWKSPKSHFLNGKLMEKGKKATQHMYLNIDKGIDGTEADAAISVAAEYPFRSRATKVIVLVHQRKLKEVIKSSEKLLEILNARGITLVSASTYPELQDNGVQGILSAHDIFKVERKKPSPQGIYDNVVTSTGGMWLDLDVFNSFETRELNAISEAFARMNTKAGQNLLPKK